MTIQQNLYFMSLVGAIAGMLSWALGVWVPVLMTLPQEEYWIAELIDLILIGLLIGAMCIAFADSWSEKGVTAKRLLTGALGGCLAGIISGLTLFWLRSRWSGEQFPWWVTILAWLINGALIGATIGIVRYGFLIRRVLLSMLGGAVGAFIGGSTLLSFGEFLPYLAHAFGLMIAGLGISFGSTVALRIPRCGVLKFVRSDDPAVSTSFEGRQQEWELLPGDNFLFGRALGIHNARQYIYVPDYDMAERHAHLYESHGHFYLRVHEENQDATGKPVYPLRVKRLNGTMVMFADNAVVLENGDEIQMGRTFFSFSLRGRGDVKDIARTSSAIVGIVLFPFMQSVLAHPSGEFIGARFAQVEKVRLLQCISGSQRPCFRITVNIVDQHGNPLEIPVFSPQRAIEHIQVSDGDTQLMVFHVGLDLWGNANLQRYAILLVDVSGSMLEPTSNGRSKFEVMQEASLRFADDFADGIDHVAVIPFDSRGVIPGVNDATFLIEKEKLEERIANTKPPQRNANTALFSATRAALKRLQEVKMQAMATEYADPQCLLVVMTDGKNDIGNEGDDEYLLDDWRPVKQVADSIGIQIVTIGFGNPQNLDEEVLKTLAWPSRRNYLPAHNSPDLAEAFQTARSFQVQRMQIAFLPKQHFRCNLIKQHQFKVKLTIDPITVIQGTFLWIAPPRGVAPPFEGVLTKQERENLPHLSNCWFLIYLVTLFFLGLLFYLLWFKVPGQVWAKEYDLLVLRQRVLAAVQSDEGS